MSFLRPLLFCLVLGLVASSLRAADSETMAERSLRDISQRQKTLLADAAKSGENLDQEALRSQVESLCHEYEALIRSNPNFAAAYASYGYLLSKVGMRKESVAILLKANQLDPDIPLVKNQLGNYLAEEGKPLEAVNYFLSAIKLEPNEPLYHYQLGTLLYEARDDFLKSGEWKKDGLEHAMHQAFKRAAELAPDRFEFVYRYGESFYDITEPDWAEAQQVWSGLEARAQTAIERQTIILHEANVDLKWDKPEEARALLEKVNDPTLAVQKQKLVAQLPEMAKK